MGRPTTLEKLPRTTETNGSRPARRSLPISLASDPSRDRLRVLVGERLEMDDADLDGADPFVALGAIEAYSRDHGGVVPFLKPDHPLGVGAVERLVEDLAFDDANRVGREDQPAAQRPATSAALRQASCAA